MGRYRWSGRSGLGRGGIQVVGVGVDGGTDGIAPGIGTEAVAVFVFREMEALDHDLAEIGEGAGGFGRDVATSGGGEEASEGGVEIAGGEVMAGEEMGDFAAKALGGLRLVKLAGVETTEQRMAGLARRAAVAAVREAEGTQRRGTSCKHGSLLKVGFGFGKTKIEIRNTKIEMRKSKCGRKNAGPSYLRVNKDAPADKPAVRAKTKTPARCRRYKKSPD